MNISKIVYLPIEIKAREFDSKVLLAHELLSRGYMVVLGQQWAMYSNFHRLPPGIVLFKSHNPIHYPAMAKAKSSGHYTCALEEEVLAASTVKSLEKNSTKNLYENLHAIFAHGELEKTFHMSTGATPDSVFIVGNPRVDLLRKPYRELHLNAVNRIKIAYGNFILVNTNFGYKNSIWESQEQLRSIAIRSGALNLSEPQSVADFEDFVRWESTCSDVLNRTIKDLASEFPEKKIIIRPHPGEVEAKVNEQYANIPNVLVIREGSHIPWTLASELLLHCSCTTGLEAALAGKRAVSLVPYSIWYSEERLSNFVNERVESANSVVELLKATCDYEPGAGVQYALTENQEGLIKSYISNVNNEFSISLIADHFDGLNVARGHADFRELPSSDRHPVFVKKCSFDASELLSKLEDIQNLRNDSVSLSKKTAATLHRLADSLYLIPSFESVRLAA